MHFLCLLANNLFFKQIFNLKYLFVCVSFEIQSTKCKSANDLDTIDTLQYFSHVIVNFMSKRLNSAINACKYTLIELSGNKEWNETVGIARRDCKIDRFETAKNPIDFFDYETRVFIALEQRIPHHFTPFAISDYILHSYLFSFFFFFEMHSHNGAQRNIVHQRAGSNKWCSN